jgi:hypothetical protein
MFVCKVKYLLVLPFVITVIGAIWGCCYIWSLPSNIANDSHQFKAAMFIVMGIIPLPIIVLMVMLRSKDKSIGRMLDLESIRID